ncbi:DeoR/GlpR family DNA-binding transcription regulator [Cryobacterium sp. PH29-G1]|uniref:DeoR/GlpR family DNA-binding transcription regulator n=1 Tax=Cryobacterium sp. PH29-G1 TaxID=3046211 RepID=UPI0024BA93F9|nr:DeoR/GlpR family DNA-binding transcription regulator [Cryobacterium sp. PH29-G1]MDJ0347904.1 DeoR/GlpR family DNA-binding transcription regulator [Cryobacterium sp. PH29-G1]
MTSTDSTPNPAAEPLPAHVRREHAQRLVDERGFVRVSELRSAFGVSGVTARADLDALVLRGAVRRVHGGAVPAHSPSEHAALRLEREHSFEEALESSAIPKRQIAQVAAGLVRSGQSVILDVGTTTHAIARALCDREDLQDVVIITNGLNIALELERAIPRFTVIVTGGSLRPLQHSLVEPLAGTVLSQVHADLAFIGCNGVDIVGGVTNVNLPEAGVKARMLAAAERVVVVADRSKLGHVHLGLVGPLSAVHTLITDAAADSAVLDSFREVGLTVLLPEIEHNPDSRP